VSSIDAALAIWDLKLQSPSPPQGANEPSRSITDNVDSPTFAFVLKMAVVDLPACSDARIVARRGRS